MKVNIKTTETFGRSLLDIVLKNRGLTKEDVDRLLHPSVEDVEHPMQLKNMGEAGKLFIKEVVRGAKIGIIPDQDVDGFTSSALLYQFLVNECNHDKENIEIFMSDTKSHGLDNEKLFKKIKKSDIDFLIMADAGTNDLKEVKELLKIGKKVLTIDHHQLNNQDDNTIIKDQDGNIIYVLLNNQLGEYSKSLSGVGVVYKFITYLTQDEMVHYMDLVAVGNVADSMDINDRELRYIVNKGLENINNEFFKYLLEKDMYTPTDVSFNIANKINAVCRFGKLEEKIDVFKALAMFEDNRVYKPRKTKNNPNPQEIVQTLQEFMARVVGNIKQRQDNAVKSALPKIDEYIVANDCLSHKAIVIINDKKGKDSLLPQNVGGLVANKLADKYKKPVMIIHTHDDEYSGSMRGFGVDSFKDILESTDIVEVKGHDNSAGVFVKKSDLPRLVKRIDKAMEDIVIVEKTGYTVDCIVDVKDLKPNDFKTFQDMKRIWFGMCEEPMFLIKGVEVNQSDFKQPFFQLLTFTAEGYKFDKNYPSNEFVREVTHSNHKGFGRPILKCDIIVKLGTNEWNKNGYFEVVDMKSEVVGVEKGLKGNTSKKDDNIPF